MSAHSTSSAASDAAAAGSWRPAPGDGSRDLLFGFVAAMAVMVPILAFGGNEVYQTYQRQEKARVAMLKLQRAHADLLAGSPLGTLPVAETAHGRDIFASACVACHGQDAKGIKGLGKDLTISNFVAAQDDAQLHQFLLTGRPDAKPIGMPPKAGRDDLSDSDLKHVVLYVRGLQDSRRMPELPAPVLASEPTDSEKAAAMQAAGGDAELAQYIASGNKLFHSLCVACHGKGGIGIKGNGKALVNNEFIRSLNDDELLGFVKQGRAPSDPKNTTGIQMPPKGGNPALKDDDILDIISYLRTLEGNTPTKTATK